MHGFKYCQDVQDWLEELTYGEFWSEAALYDIELPSREDCEQDIAEGLVDRATVLRVLKGLARIRVIEALDLTYRIDAPPIRMH